MYNSIPPHEQQLILAHILKKSREYVLTYPEIRLKKSQKLRFGELLRRRKNHEPLAYILGHKDFYGLEFKVTPDTLIPRPETEMLIEEGFGVLSKVLSSTLLNKVTLVDVGTGSGNIIISIASEMKKNKFPFSDCHFFASDISQKALRVAKHNAKKHNLEKNIKFIQGNLLEPIIKNESRSTFHVPRLMIILANLPYLSKKIYSSAMPDVKNFEPKSALYSPLEGLAHYEKLFGQMKKLEAKSYKLKAILEFSPEQKTKLQKLIKKHFPSAKMEFKKDLAGKWRMAVVEM